MIKLFAHRGFVTGDIKQNSIAALKNAYDKGFRGVEFDIWFIEGELILKHDRPEFIELKNLPRFKDYFLYKNQMEYWLDFKNLDESNVDKSLELVKKNINEEKIDLNKIYFAPFITDYEIAEFIFKKIRLTFGLEVKIMAVCERLENQKERVLLKEFLEKNKINYLSIFHKLVDENFIKLFSQTEIFTWTVNGHERLEELSKIGVKNFATDLLTV